MSVLLFLFSRQLLFLLGINISFLYNLIFLWPIIHFPPEASLPSLHGQTLLRLSPCFSLVCLFPSACAGLSSWAFPSPLPFLWLLFLGFFPHFVAFVRMMQRSKFLFVYSFLRMCMSEYTSFLPSRLTDGLDIEFH